MAIDRYWIFNLGNYIIPIDRIFKLFSAFLTGVWAAKSYGPSLYGELSVALAILAVLTTITYLGMENISLRAFAKDPEGAHLLVSKISKTYAISSAICFILGLLIFKFKPGSKEIATGFIILLTLLSSFLYPTFLYAQFKNYFLQIGLVSIGVTLAITAYRVYILRMDLDILWYALSYPIECFILYSIIFKFVKLKNNKINSEFSNAKLYYSNGIRVMISALMMVIITRLDQFASAALLGDYSVGQLAIGLRINDAALAVPLAVIQVNTPKLFNHFNNDNKKYILLVHNLSQFAVSYSIIFILFIFFFSDYIVFYLFGENYNAASSLMKIQSFNVLFLSLGQILYIMALAENQEKIVFYKILLTLPLYLILLIVLINFSGIIGVAYATSIMYFFSAIFLTFAYKKQRWQIIELINSVIPVALRR